MGSGGTYSVPDEMPEHEVSVSSFWISRFEITQAQYKKIMLKNPSHFRGQAKENHPAECVTWNNAVEFCSRFREINKVNARLPYEAEWEFASRAGADTRFYWGNDPDENYYWGHSNSGMTTHPAGTKLPNNYGLYDMAGNVWEWCMDWYDKDYYKKSFRDNPRGPSKGIYKVLRGGSWKSLGYSMRSSNRIMTAPVDYGNDAGFRIVIESDSK